MALTLTTDNMSLVLPLPELQIGPTWAANNHAALLLVDAHDHTPGKGVRVPAAALNINADLSFGSNDATALRSTRYTDQSGNLSNPDDRVCTFFKNGDLCVIDSAGNVIQLTSGGTINTASLVNNTWTRLAFSGNIVIAAVDTNVFYDGDTTGGARTVTLPKASTVPSKFYVFKQAAGTNGLVFTPDAADSIDGGAAGATHTVNATRGEWILFSDGQASGKWHILRSSQELHGASVPAAGALTTAHVLKVSGVSALTYGFIVDANVDAAAAISGSKIVSAAAGVLGVLQLDTDLGGTAADPAVVAVSGSGGTATLRSTAAILEWVAAAASPKLWQATPAGAGAGAAMTIQAQSANGANPGGALILASGSDNSATEVTGGDISIYRGNKRAVKITGTTGTIVWSTDMATSAGAGTGLTIQAQAGITTGAGGVLNLAAGAGTSSGSGGNVNVVGGAGAGAASGGGNASVTGGAGAGSGAGGALSLTAGDAPGAGNGGAVTLRSGASASGLKGAVAISAGSSGEATIRAQEVAAGRNVVSVCSPAALTGVDIPSGNGVFFITTAATMPAAGAGNAPVGGCLLIFDGSTLYVRKPGSAANTVIA